MKENIKIIVACVMTLILGTIINVTATTLLQANSISYKTSNGDTTDVNSALDRLFDINKVNEKIGNNDISNIGDGTITGAVSYLNSDLRNLVTVSTIEENINLYSIGNIRILVLSNAQLNANAYQLNILDKDLPKKEVSFRGMRENNNTYATFGKYILSTSGVLTIKIPLSYNNSSVFAIDANAQYSGIAIWSV